MKKVLPFIALIGMVLLSGCGTDMKKILTADGGKWKVEETRATYTFFDDGKFSANDSEDSVSGTYTYDEKNKKITFDITSRNSFIMEKVEYKDNKITGEIGEKQRTLIKQKTE